MEADFAVELGADDATLELPWAAPENGPRYYDLKNQPELLLNIAEARRVPELGSFLASLNSVNSSFETAKCDVWTTTEISPAEETFGAPCKFISYVDLLFCDEHSRCSFPHHEQWVRQIVQLLRKVPEIPAAAEFLVRRCYDRRAAAAEQDGFYITFYLSGYGDDEQQAKQHWVIALTLVDNALRQLSAQQRSL